MPNSIRAFVFLRIPQFDPIIKVSLKVAKMILTLISHIIQLQPELAEAAKTPKFCFWSLWSTGQWLWINLLRQTKRSSYRRKYWNNIEEVLEPTGLDAVSFHYLITVLLFGHFILNEDIPVYWLPEVK